MIRELIPFYVGLVLLLLLITYFPAVVTLLPNLIG